MGESLSYIDAIKATDRLLKGLSEHDVLMPLQAGTKAPIFHHKDGQWQRADFWKYVKKDKKLKLNDPVGILCHSLLIIDFDDQTILPDYRDKWPELEICPFETTSKGAHAYFLRTPLCDELEIFDGARKYYDRIDEEDGSVRFEVLPIDVKTRCKSGTRGLIACAPSPNKTWIRAPWDHDIRPLPDHIARDLARMTTNSIPRDVSEVSGEVSLDDERVNKLVTMLSNDRRDNYNEWIDVGITLKAIKVDLYGLWDDWSQTTNVPLGYPGELKTFEKWQSFDPRMSSSAASKKLHDLAKSDDPEAYEIFLKSDVKTAVDNIIDKKGSHLSIAKLVEVMVENLLVVTNARKTSPIFYFFLDHRWHPNEQITMIVRMLSGRVIETLENYRSKYPDTKNKVKDNDDTKNDPREILRNVILSLENNSFKTSVAYEVLSLLFDDTGNFVRTLDTKTNLIGFDNGVFDLEHGVFRNGTPEDMISKTTGIDYPVDIQQEDYDEMRTFVEQILAVEDVREYLLMQIAQNLNGRTGKNLFHFLTAFGSNGKSTLIQLVSEAFGQYAFALGSDVLTNSRPSSFGGNPLLIKLRGVRFVYIEEPSSEGASKLNAAWVKELTGGSKINARLLHSNEYVEFTPQWHMYALCNNMPELNGADGGLQRRVRKIDFPSTFTNLYGPTEDNPHVFPEITDIGDKIVKMAPAFVYMLLTKYYVHDYTYECPQSIMNSSQQLMAENNPFAMFLGLAVYRDDVRDAYFTVKDALKVWKEMSVSYRFESFLKPVPKESEVKMQFVVLLGVPCQERPTITHSDKSRSQPRSAFRGFRLRDIGDILSTDE